MLIFSEHGVMAAAMRLPQSAAYRLPLAMLTAQSLADGQVAYAKKGGWHGGWGLKLGEIQEGLIVRCEIVVALFLLLSSGTGASAECAEARDHYLSAVDGVREYLGRYVQCVTTSNGLEDCSSEFRRLSNAHTEFEKSVEEFRADCP